MCGICGFYDYSKKASLEDLQKITTTIQHRGPDDEGYFYDNFSTFNIGFGHRRLSIIDLSSLGHQPMEYEDLIIIFNGEVYNFEEIQKELIQANYKFTSTSDTEVIIKAFHYWGIDCVHKFNGMFAISIFNKKTEELLLIRDRIGVKPLYYFFDGTKLIFASELKPIINFPGFRKELSYEALSTYLYHGYISSPSSIFKNTYKLEPGKYLKLLGKKIEIKSYWNLNEKFNTRKVLQNITEEKALVELDHLITSSVNYRMIADVPVGAFLSGGYDSSLVSAVMQKLSLSPIKTFTIAFNEKKYNEASYAKEVAKYLKTDHYELEFSVKMAKDLIYEIPQFYDEPFADSSQLPTMLVSQFARKTVTVVLSGDGGDELFCGYKNYEQLLFYKKKQLLSKGLNFLNKFLPVKPLASSINDKYARLFSLKDNKDIINGDYIRSSDLFKNIFSKDFIYSLNNQFLSFADISENIQEANMIMDMNLYLPDDILVKIDRATMSCGLEGRGPLLDYRIFEYSFNLPHRLKYNQGEKKYLLKSLTHQYIPEKIMNRPKMGFGIPFFEWLRTDLAFLVQEYLSEKFINQQGIFNYKRIKFLIERFNNSKDNFYTSFIWNLIIFQLWYKKYMDNSL